MNIECLTTSTQILEIRVDEDGNPITTIDVPDELLAKVLASEPESASESSGK